MGRSLVKRCVWAIAGTLCLFTPIVHAGPQTPPSAPVTVVNTDANPVPVRAPSPLPVSGSVTISGIPSVNINNTPSVMQGGALERRHSGRTGRGTKRHVERRDCRYAVVQPRYADDADTRHGQHAG